MDQLVPLFFRHSRPALRWIGVPLVAMGVAQGCELDEEGCRRSRTCVPADGQPGGQAGTAGSSNDRPGEGGAAGAGGEGGLGGIGPVAQGIGHMEGDPCSLDGTYACMDHAQRVQLVCVHGAFRQYGICEPTERCDTRPETLGLCQPVVDECLGETTGAVVCRGAERLLCGVNLVSAESLGTCAGGCVDGECTECAPDAAPGCEFNSVRTCSDLGEWEVTPCDAAAPQCSNGKCGVPPSCLGLPEACGTGGSEACCQSPLVPGGTFLRNNDVALPATISTFRLDRFEVTVGRFRKFRAAWDKGWRPDGGSGKHVHLNDGQGLVNLAVPDSFEPGWAEDYLIHTDPDDTNLQTGDTGPYATWSGAVRENEARPLNGVTRHEAYAFCIWDGAFLPSDAEWSYAATGGDEQRAYPWGNNPPSANTLLAVYGCLFGGNGTCTDVRNIAPVGTAQGDGLFGQVDLVGNLNEWTLGGAAAETCVDCTNVSLGVVGYMLDEPCRGRAFSDDAAVLTSETCLPTSRANGYRGPTIGIRCARAP